MTRLQVVALADVHVGERQRRLSHEHVQAIVSSFERLGGQLQLQPIVLDEQLRLIDGAHRYAAAQQAGWQVISAVIVEGHTEAEVRRLEVEANLVRKTLGPAQLEAAWRLHYEPWFRARARERQLAGLKRGEVRALPVRTDAVAAHTQAISVANAAKMMTGLSLQTLNKVSEIRALCTARGISSSVREAALEAMRRLEIPHVSVTAEHRKVMARLREDRELAHGRNSDDGARNRLRVSTEQALEALLGEVLVLEQRLEQASGEALDSAVLAQHSNEELLRGVRTSLTRALVTVMTIECRAAGGSALAMKHIGSEVRKVLDDTVHHHVGSGCSDLQRAAA